MDFIKENEKYKWGIIVLNKSFKDITTIKIGGKIKILFYPFNIEKLSKAFKYINDNNLKYYIVGSGSNILASDDLFDGIIIALNKLPYYYKKEKDYLLVSAFYPTAKLVFDLVYKNLVSLEYLALIPGLLGGVIKNNGGSSDIFIDKDLLEVKYLDYSGNICILKKSEYKGDYRMSFFTDNNFIIIECKLKYSTPSILKYQSVCLNKIKTQPLKTLNIGSIFKNYKTINAWKIIDYLGYRGIVKNDVEVSLKHANFIINKGSAKAIDFIKMIDEISQLAYEKLGIKLEKEIQILS